MCFVFVFTENSMELYRSVHHYSMKGILGICLLASLSSTAQVRVASATRQSWSGGIAGHMGCYYKVEISWQSSRMPLLDSVYADGQGIGYDANAWSQVFRQSGKQSASLSFGTSRDDMEYIMTGKEPTKPLRQTDNKTLILVFKNGNKRELVKVTSFVNLEPLNYP